MSPSTVFRMIGALAVVLVAGCRFGVEPLFVDDGGAPFDAAVDNSVPLDADELDLLTHIPDGYTLPDGLQPGERGYPCTLASQCGNGLCVDEFCCDDLCDQTDPAHLCMACNVPGFEGHCVTVLEGTDPRGQCAQDPAASCGQDGTCDGNGACREYAAGSECAGPSCANGLVTYARACDGLGGCLPAPGPVSCYPYTCASATDCAATCSTGAECAANVTCMPNGGCGKRAAGQPCAMGVECQSTFCAQGVCCGSDCTAKCFACNLPGTTGLCAAVPSGLDPLDQCMAKSRATCDTDGQCDGLGGCRLWAAGTTCVAPSCDGDQVDSARTCDGLGKCLDARTTSCGAYTCNPTSGTCYTQPCSNNNQCAKGKMCKPPNGKCM